MQEINKKESINNINGGECIGHYNNNYYGNFAGDPTSRELCERSTCDKINNDVKNVDVLYVSRYTYNNQTFPCPGKNAQITHMAREMLKIAQQGGGTTGSGIRIIKM